MSLIPRPASPGARLDWRPRLVGQPAPVPAQPATIRTVPAPVSAEEGWAAFADRCRDLDAQRRVGLDQALDRLRTHHASPTYRRTRAYMALARSVELQARIAGLGHVHVGTEPCGPLCQPLGQHATEWRGR
jgi:hypothetical protein